MEKAIFRLVERRNEPIQGKSQGAAELFEGQQNTGGERRWISQSWEKTAKAGEKKDPGFAVWKKNRDRIP